jgi:hypothetical protein
MDIGIRNARAFKVSGQISSLIPPPTPTLGAPGVNAAVLMLLNRDPAAPDDGGTRAAGTVPLIPTTGQFELANVLPGAYELFARVSDPSVAATGAPAFAWGRARFEVRDNDVANISITVPPSVEVRGTARGDRSGKIPPNTRVTLLPGDATVKHPRTSWYSRAPAWSLLTGLSLCPRSSKGTTALPASQAWARIFILRTSARRNECFRFGVQCQHAIQ